MCVVFSGAVRVVSPPLVKTNDVSGTTKSNVTHTVRAVKHMYALVRVMPKKVDICICGHASKWKSASAWKSGPVWSFVKI